MSVVYIWRFARVADEIANYSSNYPEDCTDGGRINNDDCDNEKSVDDVDDHRHEDDEDELEDEYDEEDDDDENGFASMKIFHGPDPVIDTNRVEKIPAKEPKFYAVPLKSALKKPSTPTQDQGSSSLPGSVKYVFIPSVRTKKRLSPHDF